MSRNKRPAGIRKSAYAAFLAAALFLGACGKGEQQEALFGSEDEETFSTPEQANYKTAEAARGEYIKTAEGPMHVYYPITARLNWEGDNAAFREILVKKGDTVKEGDPLAAFDITVSNAYREELRLALLRKNEDTNAGKEERLAAIEEERQKMEGLSDYSLHIAQLKLDRLEAEYEQFVYQAEWETARLEESFNELEETLANDTLTAPFDGVIDNVATYSPGDPVTPDQVIVTMHSEDKFYLVADDSSGKLRYNVDVSVEAGRKNDRRSYEGRVVASPNILPPAAPDGLTLIELYGSTTLQELQGTLQFRFNVEELKDILLVDWSAVSAENGKYFVYVLDGDMVQKRYIMIGLTNRKEAWVLDGLFEGQNVIGD